MAEKKLTRGQKAAATRRANDAARSAQPQSQSIAGGSRSSGRRLIVLHGALGSHVSGSSIAESDLGDRANIRRLLDIGAVAYADPGEEVAPVEVEIPDDATDVKAEGGEDAEDNDKKKAEVTLNAPSASADKPALSTSAPTLSHSEPTESAPKVHLINVTSAGSTPVTLAPDNKAKQD